MVDHWLGINSTQYDSHCGEQAWAKLVDALNGTDNWQHWVNEVHWFVLDLGQTYTIKKVRGRSYSGADPIDVNIYIDDNNPPTTLCEEGITTWQNTEAWVEITLTSPGTGRYIKVEIEVTEDGDNYINWDGKDIGFDTIFDIYGDIGGAPPVPGVKPVAGKGLITHTP